MAAVAILGFIALYLLTVPETTADTVVYVDNMLTYSQQGSSAAPSLLWEFGHVLWRPFGYSLWLVGHPFLSSWSRGNPALEMTAVLIGVNFVVGLLLTWVLYLLCRRLGLAARAALAVTAGFMLCSTILNYVHSGMSYNSGLLAQLAGLLLLLNAIGNPRRAVSLAAQSGCGTREIDWIGKGNWISWLARYHKCNMARTSIRAAGCPTCASGIAGICLDRVEEGLSHVTVGSSRTVFSAGRVLRCAKCGHGFRASQPTYEELRALYQHMDTDVYESEEFARIATAKRHAAILNRHAGRSGKLLDIGCASGLFLDQAARSGWDVFGVEPNAVLSAEAAGRLGKNRVWCTTLEEANLDAGSFDAITMWDVLEHVVDPPGFLQLCARLLRPAGKILAKVPDFDSLQARLMGARWPLLLPEHLGYFTRVSLCACGERANLRTVGFGRGRITYSTGYVLYRLGQHGFPGARIGYRIAGRSFLGRIPISVRLGELYVFFSANYV